MKFDELDEWQGLTREMVDHYLNRTGWCKNAATDIRLLKPQYAHVSLKMGLSAAVERIASIEGRSVQALLREINPRMRKGMPSQAALAAHDHWLVRDTETGEISLHRAEGGNLYSVIHYRNGTKNPDSEALPDFGTWMEFWPCDEHGNKVRWPTDAQGNML